MELHAYWNIIKRRWLLILIPAAVVLLAALLTYSPPPPLYNVGVRFIVGQPPTEAAALEDEERLANWQTSEYVVNGLADWVRGLRFAQQVSERLATQGIDVPAFAIMGSMHADNTRSLMQVSLTSGGDPETLRQMMLAVIAVLQTENGAALPQLYGQPATLLVLDDPVVNGVNAGIRSQLDLPLRILLALGAGLGLAFLVEYLDPTLRRRQEIEALSLPILGEIPRHKPPH